LFRIVCLNGLACCAVNALMGVNIVLSTPHAYQLNLPVTF